MKLLLIRKELLKLDGHFYQLLFLIKFVNGLDFGVQVMMYLKKGNNEDNLKKKEI